MSYKSLLLTACVSSLLWACSSEQPEKSDESGNAPAPLTEVAETSPPEIATPAEPETLSTTSEETSVRSAEAHVHGNAKLALVLDGSTLTAELESPLYNLVGFEHAAETDEQRAAIETAEKVLQDPASVFVINDAANCVTDANALDVHLEADSSHDDHSHEDGHDHDDDHGHDEEHGHDDDHDHDGDHDHDEAHATHKDVLITYTFTCETPSAISPITVNLLAKFPNMEKLEVVYLGPNTQDLFTLTPTDTVITLRP